MNYKELEDYNFNQCMGNTAKGSRCKRKIASDTQYFCYDHGNQRTAKKLELIEQIKTAKKQKEIREQIQETYKDLLNLFDKQKKATTSEILSDADFLTASQKLSVKELETGIKLFTIKLEVKKKIVILKKSIEDFDNDYHETYLPDCKTSQLNEIFNYVIGIFYLLENKSEKN